ncbi:MAG: hypothetical protein AAGJ50_07690, partial [Pseudomonadota bacterium]
MVRMKVVSVGLVALAAAGCAALGDFSPDNPGFDEVPGTFVGRFLALSDADMAGTAYADGGLEPFDGAVDEVTLFSAGRPIATAGAPNSVISWPHVIDVAPNGRHAYAVETRGSLAEPTDRVESAYTAFPEGRLLQAYAVDGTSLQKIATLENVGPNPQFVEVSPDGRFLIVGTEQN